VSAISRAIATARACASFALRVCARAAEYTPVRLECAFAGAASALAVPILTRLRSAAGAIQKTDFLFKQATPKL
jgi:hypothetical protein